MFLIQFHSIRRLLFGLLRGRSSSIGEPCLNEASWCTLPFLSSAPSNEAELGVNGFAYFSRKTSRPSSGAETRHLWYRIQPTLITI